MLNSFIFVHNLKQTTMKVFGKVPKGKGFLQIDVERAAKNLKQPTKVVDEGDNWVVYIVKKILS